MNLFKNFLLIQSGSNGKDSHGNETVFYDEAEFHYARWMEHLPEEPTAEFYTITHVVVGIHPGENSPRTLTSQHTAERRVNYKLNELPPTVITVSHDAGALAFYARIQRELEAKETRGRIK